MIIVDAHLDLAYNAIRYDRELLKSIEEIRRVEEGGARPNETAIVSFPELREAGVGLVFATLFVGPASSRMFEEGTKLVYTTADEAHKHAQTELDYYHALWDEVDYLRPVFTRADLNDLLAEINEERNPAVGMVILMEGADPIRQPEELEAWYERGVRIIGPAWDDTRYAAGAWKEGGGITREGFHLLEIMADLGVILDLTHMADKGIHQALDSFEGVIIASHSNARALVPGKRQLSDEQIGLIAERGGVVGVVLANYFLKKDHRRGDPKEQVSIQHVIAHIDHICQLVGDAEHVGIGSDFDGGFGVESIPGELKNVADLHLLAQGLQEYGYSSQEVEGVMGENWLRLLGNALD